MYANPNDTWTSAAIQRGDIDAVKQRVVEDSEYLASRDFVGDTPLLTAIGFDHVELVRFLLAQGADPNVEVDDGYTCLLVAVESDKPGSTEMMRLLIDVGADLQQTGINGWTPLHMAACLGKTEKARLLIKAGAEVNRRTVIDGEETPLMEAAYSGHPETVQLLLDQGADASMRETVENRTPLELARDAARGPDPKVFEILENEEFDVDLDELIGTEELTQEQRDSLETMFKDLDMAEEYRKNSEHLKQHGDHQGVIRVLSEHEPQR